MSGKLFGVPIVQEGRRGQYVGKITLNVNKEHKVTSSNAELISTGDYTLDARIKKNK